MSSFSLPRADWTYGSEVDAAGNIDLEKEKNDIAISQSPDTGSSASLSSTEGPGPQVGEDGTSRRTGDVQIYLYYVKSVGWWATLIFVLAIVGFIFCTSFPSRSIHCALCWTEATDLTSPF